MPLPLLAAAGIGAGINTLASIGSGISDLIAAGKQRREAAQLRTDAKNLQVQPIRQEFKDKLRQDQMLGLSGLPGYELANQAIGSNTANAVRSIRESSQSGAQALAGVGAAVTKQNEATNQLSLDNMKYKAGEEQQVGADLLTIGNEEQSLIDKRDAKRDKILDAATAQENAATYNKSAGIKTILGGVSQGASSITGQAIYQDRFNKLTNSGVGGGMTQPPAVQSTTTPTTSLNQSSAYGNQYSGLNGASLSSNDYQSLVNEFTQGMANGSLDPVAAADIKRLIQEYQAANGN